MASGIEIDEKLASIQQLLMLIASVTRTAVPLFLVVFSDFEPHCRQDFSCGPSRQRSIVIMT